MLLGATLTFLILAIIAGILGFSGVEIISIQIAKVLFYLFLALFVISLLYSLVSGRRPPY